MVIETIPRYVLQELFLNRVANACIGLGFKLTPIPAQTSTPVQTKKSIFDILRGDNVEYRLEQIQEECFPEQGQTFGRYTSTLFRANGSVTPVLESCRTWTGYGSRDNDYGRRDERTALLSEDRLARAVFEELKPVL